MIEFWPTKMLFEHHLDNPVDPDEIDTFDVDRAGLDNVAKAKTAAQELSELKSTSGGLKLAYKLMSASLILHVKILYICSQPIWSWYTEQVETVKSPSDGLRYCVKLAAGRWTREPHSLKTITHSLVDADSLADIFGCVQPGPACGIGLCRQADVDAVAHKVLMLTWHILSHVAWSSSRHSVPPECFANIAAANAGDSERGVTAMRKACRV